MKKTSLIVIGVFVLIMVGVLLYSALKPVSLKVINTIPGSGMIYNPFLPVTFYFNRMPKQGEITLDISPKTNVKITTSKNNSIQVTPQTNFLPDTTYRIYVNTKPQFVLTFTTEQTASNTPNWNQEFDQAMQQYLQKNSVQDAALADIRQNAPIKQSGFTINYSYADNTYTVILNVPYSQNKQYFLTWLAKKGVTDLTLLRIKYIEE